MDVNVELLIAVLGFAGSAVAVIWRVALLTAKIERNAEAVKDVNARLNRYIEKLESSVEEQRQQTESIARVLARIEAQMRFHEKNKG